MSHFVSQIFTRILSCFRYFTAYVFSNIQILVIEIVGINVSNLFTISLLLCLNVTFLYISFFTINYSIYGFPKFGKVSKLFLF